MSERQGILFVGAFVGMLIGQSLTELGAPFWGVYVTALALYAVGMALNWYAAKRSRRCRRS